MDPSLLKERRAFLKRAKDAQGIKVPHLDGFSSQQVTLMSALQPHSGKIFAMDSLPETHGRFRLLSIVVKHMKTRHLEGDYHALSVEEILEEVSLLNQPKSDVLWLKNEALPKNPKIGMTPESKFYFKPKYNIRDRNGLYKLLRDHEMNGLGGVEFDDIAECIKDADRVVKSLGDSVYDYMNPHNKKRVIYFNVKGYDLGVDECFKELWRSVSVVGVSEHEVELYLDKNGLNSISADKPKLVSNLSSNRNTRKATKRRNPQPLVLKHNEHMKDILMDYSENKPPSA
ncbi:hypothetical protein Aperf_G00000085168 [Anoplocephala perfoliata]